MSSSCFSLKPAKKCASLDTISRCGVVPNFSAVFLNIGNINNASKKVLMTLTCRLASLPSMTSHFPTLKPAFSTIISSLSKPSARFANAFTDAEEERSRGHTSMQSDVHLVEDRIDSLAFSPFETVRTARMSFEQLRRAKWRAASRPKPTFEPVTITVWPLKSCVGYVGVTKSCEYNI